MTAAGGNLRPMPARALAEGIVIAVRLTPKGGGDKIIGVDAAKDAPHLRARVLAPAEDGKANAALAELLARWLDVPKSRAEVVSGGKSRMKQVLISGDAAELMERLAARIV